MFSRRSAAIAAMVDARKQASDMWQDHDLARGKADEAIQLLRSVLPELVTSDRILRKWTCLSDAWSKRASELNYNMVSVSSFYLWTVPLRYIRAREGSYLHLKRYRRLAIVNRERIIARCEALVYGPEGAQVQLDEIDDALEGLGGVLDSFERGDYGLGYDSAGAGVDLGFLHRQLDEARDLYGDGNQHGSLVLKMLVTHVNQACESVERYELQVLYDQQRHARAIREVAVTGRRIHAASQALALLVGAYGDQVGPELEAGLYKARECVTESRRLLGGLHGRQMPNSDWRLRHDLAFRVVDLRLQFALQQCYQVTLAQRQLERRPQDDDRPQDEQLQDE